MDSNLQIILSKFRDSSSGYTHSSQLAPTTGKYRIDRKNSEFFWSKYCDLIFENPDAIAGLAERPNEYLPVLGDMDIKLPYNKETNIPDCKKKLYSFDDAKEIVSIYQKILKNIVKDCKPKNLICALLEKKMPYISDNDIKSGFHIHFPFAWLSNCDQDVHVTPRVIQALKDRNDILSNLGLDDLSKIVDPKCTRKHWLMYGSRKDSKLEAYKISKFFDHNSNEISIDKAMKDYRILDASENEVKIEKPLELFTSFIFDSFSKSKYYNN
jgi:hypothetical protein